MNDRMRCNRCNECHGRVHVLLVHLPSGAAGHRRLPGGVSGQLQEEEGTGTARIPLLILRILAIAQSVLQS